MNHTFWSIATALMLIVAIPAAAQDYSGSWTGVVTESTTDCKRLGKGTPGTYRLTFAQQGAALTAMENTVMRPYQGVFKEGDTRRVVLRGTYPDKGGYVTEEVALDFTGDASGSGHSVWSWSDGWYQCGGEFRFTLTKAPSP